MYAYVEPHDIGLSATQASSQAQLTLRCGHFDDDITAVGTRTFVKKKIECRTPRTCARPAARSTVSLTLLSKTASSSLKPPPSGAVPSVELISSDAARAASVFMISKGDVSRTVSTKTLASCSSPVPNRPIYGYQKGSENKECIILNNALLGQ